MAIDFIVREWNAWARGYAVSFPVADNDTAASCHLNRRVEMILSDKNGNIVPR